MIKRQHDKPCLFVLDTNVLMHDPTAIFRFQEHDIFLPMVVLEELDAAKKGMSEVARNVRQVSRFLDHLMCDADKDEIDAGLVVNPPIENAGGRILPPTGRLYFQTEHLRPRVAEAAARDQRRQQPARHRSGPARAAPGPHRRHRLQGHQPAHQGRGAGHPGGGLLQRSGP